ncbi:class I ribonucleotide reductase maintenance protein YfaE [Colwellia sp. E2M01]|uniref:class I ribonucleotide reductase maintenance protein YfaE n=1 Tax=Colwellia sp. E2M01 TaxID=2841561 RepID=UPI001C08CED1|nr:class I ribonucleotide reductase maintenance protein YfaE [Colwellia sp. E2M01]MBU2871486.1 2Fe-2S ferredoxin-like protein [Colwellia sp. E2M01]
MTTKNTTQKVNSNLKLEPKISVQGKVVHYKNSKQTLLDCLESADVEVHYHCRDGFCGACRVKLVEGDINYPMGEPLAYVGEKEILPCCCIPITDITILIDE